MFCIARFLYVLQPPIPKPMEVFGPLSPQTAAYLQDCLEPINAGDLSVRRKTHFDPSPSAPVFRVDIHEDMDALSSSDNRHTGVKQIKRDVYIYRTRTYICS